MSDDHFLSEFAADLAVDEIKEESTTGTVTTTNSISPWLYIVIPIALFIAAVAFMYYFGFTNTHMG